MMPGCQGASKGRSLHVKLGISTYLAFCLSSHCALLAGDWDSGCTHDCRRGPGQCCPVVWKSLHLSGIESEVLQDVKIWTQHVWRDWCLFPDLNISADSLNYVQFSVMILIHHQQWCSSGLWGTWISWIISIVQGVFPLVFRCAICSMASPLHHGSAVRKLRKGNDCKGLPAFSLSNM